MPVKDSLIASAKRTGDNFKNPRFREFVAEFVGVFTLLVVGNGTIASSLLEGKKPNPFPVCFCYGLGAMIATLAGGHISGAHINPAATVGQAVMGMFPWSKVWYYLLAQYLGSIASTFIIYVVYYDAISAFNQTAYPNLNIASIFTTLPGPGLTVRGALVDQVIGTAMLIFACCSIGNSKGFRVPKHMQAMFTWVLITGLCMTFGLNCGAIFNPARDFTPRLFFALITGDWTVFAPLNGHYWYVAGLIAPHVGAIIGLALFKLASDHEGPGSESDDEIKSSSTQPPQVVYRLKNDEPGLSQC